MLVKTCCALSSQVKSSQGCEEEAVGSTEKMVEERLWPQGSAWHQSWRRGIFRRRIEFDSIQFNSNSEDFSSKCDGDMSKRHHLKDLKHGFVPYFLLVHSPGYKPILCLGVMGVDTKWRLQALLGKKGSASAQRSRLPDWRVLTLTFVLHPFLPFF